MPGLCTFCDDPLDGSLEHLLQNALGGRRCSRFVICSKHNNFFGNTIDKVLAKQFELLCNLFAVRNGRGAEAPTIRRMSTVDGRQFDLAPGGLMLARGRCQTVDVDGGKRLVSIEGATEEQARSLSAQYVRQFGDEVVLHDATCELKIGPATMSFGCEIGGDTNRAVAKSALMFLASAVGTDAVRGSEFLPIREFILVGGDAADHVCFDFETKFEWPLEFDKLPPFRHRVAIFADQSSRSAIGLVELFGTFRYTVLLSERWLGGNVTLLHGVDPTTGASMSIETADARAPLSVDEFRSRQAPVNDTIQERIKNLFAIMRERHTAMRIEEVVATVRHELAAVADGRCEVTRSDLEDILRRAAARFVAMHGGAEFVDILHDNARTASSTMVEAGLETDRILPSSEP